MPHLRFQSKLFSDQGAHFIPVPAEVVTALGRSKRLPLTVTINAFAFQATVAVHRGRHFLSVRQEVCQAAGLTADDAVAVRLEFDAELQKADLPADLLAAIQDDPRALAAFEALSPRDKKDVVAWVSDAKQTETRQRRLARALTMLRSRRRRPS